GVAPRARGMGLLRVAGGVVAAPRNGRPYGGIPRRLLKRGGSGGHYCPGRRPRAAVHGRARKRGVATSWRPRDGRYRDNWFAWRGSRRGIHGGPLGFCRRARARFRDARGEKG